MGNLGWTEMIFIAIVALMVFGPKRLPEMGRKLGRIMGQLRQASDQFKQVWDNEVEKSNLKEIKDLQKSIQSDLSPNNLLNNTINNTQTLKTDDTISAETTSQTNSINSSDHTVDENNAENSLSISSNETTSEPSITNISPPSGDTIERAKPSFDVVASNISSTINSTPETIPQTEEVQPVTLTKN